MFQENGYINISSQSENAVALSAAEPNSDFEVFYDSLDYGTDIDVALYSITLNASPNSKQQNASDLLDCYVITNIVQPSLRVGNQRTPALRKLEVAQKNERQKFEFGNNLMWQRCAFSSLNRIRIQLATDSFQRSAGNAVELHAMHTPTGDNATTLCLAVRPARPVTGE